jgi:hypothetical protein
MSGRDSIQSVLALRKLTRAIADAVRVPMNEYLVALTPLFQPKAHLGDYISGGSKEPSLRSDKALKELLALYEKVAPGRPFNLPREILPPFNLANLGLEITPLDYTHVVQVGGESRKIQVRRPLTWILSYSGYSHTRLPELIDSRTRSTDALQRFVVSYLTLHLATKNQPAALQVFKALHFPVTTTTVPELGQLPVTQISIDVSTGRPSDAVVVESAELTGMDAFEEVVNPEEIMNIRDPLRERLVEIAKQFTPELV